MFPRLAFINETQKMNKQKQKRYYFSLKILKILRGGGINKSAPLEKESVVEGESVETFRILITIKRIQS